MIYAATKSIPLNDHVPLAKHAKGAPLFNHLRAVAVPEEAALLDDLPPVAKGIPLNDHVPLTEHAKGSALLNHLGACVPEQAALLDDLPPVAEGVRLHDHVPIRPRPVVVVVVVP